MDTNIGKCTFGYLGAVLVAAGDWFTAVCEHNYTGNV